jgi:hypothetical protein
MMVPCGNRHFFRKNCGKLGISAPQYAVAGLFSAFRGEDSGSFVELRLPLWRVLSIAVEISRLHQQSGRECNRLWVLKKSIFLKTTKIWGIENV